MTQSNKDRLKELRKEFGDELCGIMSKGKVIENDRGNTAFILGEFSLWQWIIKNFEPKGNEAKEKIKLDMYVKAEIELGRPMVWERDKNGRIGFKYIERLLEKERERVVEMIGELKIKHRHSYKDKGTNEKRYLLVKGYNQALDQLKSTLKPKKKLLSIIKGEK